MLFHFFQTLGNQQSNKKQKYRHLLNLNLLQFYLTAGSSPTNPNHRTFRHRVGAGIELTGLQCQNLTRYNALIQYNPFWIRPHIGSSIAQLSAIKHQINFLLWQDQSMQYHVILPLIGEGFRVSLHCDGAQGLTIAIELDGATQSVHHLRRREYAFVACPFRSHIERVIIIFVPEMRRNHHELKILFPRLFPHPELFYLNRYEPGGMKKAFLQTFISTYRQQYMELLSSILGSEM